MRATAERPRPTAARGLWRGALLGAFVLAMGACSTDFDPYAEGPPFFAIDAFLDGRDDTLFVRVQDFRRAPGAPAQPLAARVTLTSEAPGETPEVAVLRDSIVTLAEGGTGSLFWTTTPLRPGREATLRAERADTPEAASRAVLLLPPGTVVSETQRDDSVIRRLRFLDETERGAPVEVVYEAQRVSTGDTATITVPYGLSDLAGGLTLAVNLINDAARLRDAFGLPSDGASGEVALLRAEVRYVAVSPDPVPVRDGRGAVSWALPVAAPWQVPTPALAEVGLVDAQ